VDWIQLNEGSDALPYEKTTSKQNAFDLTYLGNRKNLLKCSEDWSNSYWSHSSGISHDSDHITITDTSGIYFYADSGFVCKKNTTYTMSIKAKKGSLSNLSFGVFYNSEMHVKNVVLDENYQWFSLTFDTTITPSVQPYLITTASAPGDLYIAAVQINEGSSILPYEKTPYSDIQLGNTSGVDTNDPAILTQGLSFDGVDDFASSSGIPDSLVTGAITLLVVANCKAAFSSLLTKVQSNGASNNPFDFYTRENNQMFLVRAPASSDNRNEFKGPIGPLNEYHMYGVRCTDGNLATVPDFFLDTTKTAGTCSWEGSGFVTGANANLQIGKRPDSGVILNGVISYVLIYNRALTDEEVTQVYRHVKQKLTPKGITLP
jgi:hypothetical protein